VPQRLAPVEVPGRPRLWRIERHDTTEAGAECANHAPQAYRADSEVVVLREHLDQDWTGRREVVPLRKSGHRFLGERDGMLAHDRGFTGIEAEDQIAVGDGLELVERVEQLQRVERLLIAGIVLERALEGTASAGLIAGPQQMVAEIRVRPRVRIVKGQRS